MKRAYKLTYKLTHHYTELGSYLQASRLKAGLSQREVSIELGYSSAQFISNFERGISTPPAKKARLLIKLYRISPDLIIQKQLAGKRNVLKEALVEQ